MLKNNKKDIYSIRKVHGIVGSLLIGMSILGAAQLAQQNNTNLEVGETQSQMSLPRKDTWDGKWVAPKMGETINRANYNEGDIHSIVRLKSDKGIGTGTFVRKNTILTAAHVVADGNNLTYTTKYKGKYITRPIKKSQIHLFRSSKGKVYNPGEEFNSDQQYVDLALITLDDNIHEINPRVTKLMDIVDTPWVSNSGDPIKYRGIPDSQGGLFNDKDIYESKGRITHFGRNFPFTREKFIDYSKTAGDTGMTGAAVQNKDGYIYGVYIGNESGETDVYDSANSLSLEFSKEHLDWIYSLINKNSNQNRDRTERNSSSVAENQGNKVLHNNTTKKPENAKHTDPRDWMGGGGFGNASSAPSRSSQPVNAGGVTVSGGGNSTSHTTSIGNRSNYNEIAKPDLRNNNTDNNTVNNTRPWKIENTIHNKSAKIIFKLLTEKYGLSGESASGWMAIMEYESLFHPYQTGIGNDSNHYGLFMLNENRYKSSKYYKENATLEEEIVNQIQFFIDNHVLSESSQSFLKENNIKDINLVDNSSGISTNILHKLLNNNNSDVNENIIKVSEEINEFFNKDKIKADHNKLLKNKLIKEIKNSTESKPADKPSSANTENKPVDKPSSTNTEAKPVDKPSSANTEAKPADKPSSANTENKPVNKPSSTNTEAKPVDKPSSANTEAKPADKPSSANTENKPVNKPSSTNTEAKPVDKPSSANTEAKPADKPSSANTENKPVDKPSSTNTETKPVDKPSSANTEAKPADKPSSANTENKPVDKPSTNNKQTVENKVIVKDKNNLTKEEVNKINDKIKETKPESFVINTTKNIKYLKLSDKDVISSLIENNLESKKVSEIEVKNELPKNEKGIIIAKVEENKETKTNKLVLETIPSKNLIVEEKENNKLLEKEKEIDNIVEDVNNDEVKNLVAEKDELKVTRFMTKDGKEIRDAEVGENKDKEIKDKDGNVYELETTETKDGITTNVYKLKEDKVTKKEAKPENKLEDKSQSVKPDKKTDEDKISDIIDDVNKVDEKENKPSEDGTKALINEKEELKVTKFVTKDGKEIKEAEVGENKDKEVKDKDGNVYELETTETKDGITTNVYKLKSEDKKVSPTEIEDKTISPVEVNENTKPENKSDLEEIKKETKKDKKSSNDSNLNTERTNTSSKVNDNSNKNTSNNSSSSNSETTRQTPNTSVGNNNSALLFGTSLMSAGLAGIALKRRKNN